MLRRWNYRDYYHPDISKASEEEEHMRSHMGMGFPSIFFFPPSFPPQPPNPLLPLLLQPSSNQSINKPNPIYTYIHTHTLHSTPQEKKSQIEG